MQDEPYNDHEREEDVERKRDRKVRKTKVGGDGILEAAARLRGPVDDYDACRCIDGVISPERCRRVEGSGAHLESRST